MRYSTEPNTPGFELWLDARLKGEFVRVYLDGVEQKFVFLADTDTGELGRDKIVDGNFVIENGEWASERFTGKVKIVLEKMEPPSGGGKPNSWYVREDAAETATEKETRRYVSDLLSEMIDHNRIFINDFEFSDDQKHLIVHALKAFKND